MDDNRRRLVGLQLVSVLQIYHHSILFNVIDRLIELTCSEHNMQEALNQQRIDQIELEKSLMEKEGNEDDEDDDEYVLENRNAFELFEDEFVDCE